MTDWVSRFFKLAKEVSTWSKDPDCKVGVVIVSPDRRLFTTGYNGFPIGVADSEARLSNKRVKLDLTVHAEVNAILNARRDLSGWILFSTKPVCVGCAKAIIQAGIATVWCPELAPESSWFRENMEAIELLNEAQIQSYFIRMDSFETI